MNDCLGPEIGKCYKATSGTKYFFGKLMRIDSSLRTYHFHDLRKGYEVVAPIDNTVLEPYEEVGL